MLSVQTGPGRRAEPYRHTHSFLGNADKQRKKEKDIFIPGWQDSTMTKWGEDESIFVFKQFWKLRPWRFVGWRVGEQIWGRKMGRNYCILAPKAGKWKIIGRYFLFGLDQPMLSRVKNNKYTICNIMKSPLKSPVAVSFWKMRNKLQQVYTEKALSLQHVRYFGNDLPPFSQNKM